MITSRYITPEDRELLANSLSGDEFHRDTPVDFFYEEGTICSVFCDEEGIVLFVRAKPVYDNEKFIAIICMDIQYLNNLNARRNMKAMLTGFPIIEERARKEGFAGFLFQSEMPLLRRFCVKRLGFQEANEQFLYKVLQQEPLDKSGNGVL